MKGSSKLLHGIALLCLLVSLVLEILPIGAVLIFAPGPNREAMATYSYFSLTPFGYANFFPLPAGLLTIAAAVLCAVGLLAKKRPSGLFSAAFTCNLLAAMLSSMQRLVFGPQYMSAAGWVITALLVVSAVLQAAANRRPKPRA